MNSPFNHRGPWNVPDADGADTRYIGCSRNATLLRVSLFASILPMTRFRRNRRRDPLGDAAFRPDRRRTVPHAFVLEALDAVSPVTRPMFGCVAVYVGERIVFVLRDKTGAPADNGVWLATTEDHHRALRREFPHMRSIHLFGKAVTGWQVLPVDAPDFEEAALRACELVLARDPRIGKIPLARRRGKAAAPRSARSRK